VSESEREREREREILSDRGRSRYGLDRARARARERINDRRERGRSQEWGEVAKLIVNGVRRGTWVIRSGREEKGIHVGIYHELRRGEGSPRESE